MSVFFSLVLPGAIAYALGAVSAARFVARARGVDLTPAGEKPGAEADGDGRVDFAEAGRVLGKRVGALVFLADLLKAQLAMGLAWQIGGALGGHPDWAGATAGILVVAGEVWPAQHRFRGGRGAASAAGALLAVSPFTLLMCATICLLVSSLTGRRDHAELISISLMPAVAIFVGGRDLALMSLAIALAAMLLWIRQGVIAAMMGAGRQGE